MSFSYRLSGNTLDFKITLHRDSLYFAQHHHKRELWRKQRQTRDLAYKNVSSMHKAHHLVPSSNRKEKRERSNLRTALVVPRYASLYRQRSRVIPTKDITSTDTPASLLILDIESPLVCLSRLNAST